MRPLIKQVGAFARRVRVPYFKSASGELPSSALPTCDDGGAVRSERPAHSVIEGVEFMEARCVGRGPGWM
jgi:hypothetical protein